MTYQYASSLAADGSVRIEGVSGETGERFAFRVDGTHVSGTVGTSPSITYLHNPPHLLAHVR